MKQYISSVLLILVLILSSCNNPEEDLVLACEEGYIQVNEQCVSEEVEPRLITDQTMVHDDIEREYEVYIPGGIPYDAPVVMVLHGFTGTSFGIRTYSGMNDLADKYKFAVVYPQGTPLLAATHWNSELDNTTVDDIGFLESLVQFVQSEYNVSTENTFVTGHSNGGFMSYTLACQSTDVFKAIASYAGLMSGTTWETCEPTKKISILQIHGTNDTVVPNDGTMTSVLGFGGAPEIHTMLSFWTEHNETDILEEYDISDISHVYEHTSDTNGYIVKYIEIKGQTHDWPYDDVMGEDEDSLNDASQYIWEFFEQLID